MSRKHNDNSGISDLSSKCSQFTADSEEGDQEDKIELATQPTQPPEILFIEPFYSGSHKQLVDLLKSNFPNSTLITLSGKKWPWRARCSALIVSTLIPSPLTSERILFCSSVLSLAELLGLRSDLHSLKKIVYFHENQFNYPIKAIKDRDIQFAYNQITTSLAADEIIFNSEFNHRSFVENFHKIIKLFPDYRPKQLLDRIQPKCRVLYFPVQYPLTSKRKGCNDCLEIVWPHRWEFDKAPETFVKLLLKLVEHGCDFRVHILGGQFADVPDAFEQVKERLNAHILTFGYVESRADYYDILRRSDVVVSTAIHEFFGVSTLEATYCGCFPIVPNALVYPEIYPSQCCYSSESACLDMLIKYCQSPEKAFIDREDLLIDFERFSLNELLPQYGALFHVED